MKKYGTVIALGLAILFGVVAVILVNKWLTAQNPAVKVEKSDKLPTASIVVAATDLNIGSRLAKENLALSEWPRGNIPQGAFETIEDVEGRVTMAKLVAGNPVLNGGLAAPGSGAGLVAVIKPGMRAMAIQVNEVTGVGGFILPNTFVDVIAIDKNKTARTLLDKVEVLAIAQETYIEEGKPKVVRTVTLELTPQDAEKLALQTNKGAIQLVLRNPLDEKEKPKPKVVRRVRRARRRVYTPPPPTFEVEIIRGERAPEKYKFKEQ